MFCSNCGHEISDKLNYCKSCGVRLAKEHDVATAKSMFDSFLTTIGIVIIGGFGILVGLVAVLLRNGVDPKDTGIIAMMYLSALTITSFMLLRLLPRLIDARLNSSKPANEEKYVAPQISARTPAQLEEFRQPASVVDATTRNFEEIPR